MYTFNNISNVSDCRDRRLLRDHRLQKKKIGGRSSASRTRFIGRFKRINNEALVQESLLSTDVFQSSQCYLSLCADSHQRCILDQLTLSGLPLCLKTTGDHAHSRTPRGLFTSSATCQIYAIRTVKRTNGLRCFI